MLVDLHRLIHVLNKMPLHNIPEGTLLTYDVTGFSLKGNTNEETLQLNLKWRNYIDILNKLANVEEYLTVSEIATHLNMSSTTVHKILKGQDKENPVLPFIRTSIGIRIKSSDYLQYLERNYHPNS